jgi:hypothetical protein
MAAGRERQLKVRLSRMTPEHRLGIRSCLMSEQDSPIFARITHGKAALTFSDRA